LSAWRKSIPKTYLIIGGSFLLLIVIGVLIWKPLRVFNLQGLAGERINAFIEAHASKYASDFT
jgi:type II secretory pathway component PulM